MYYRTTPTDRGDVVSYDEGGFYEKIKDGTPQLASIGSDYTGFARSQTPEVCASLSAAASLFASAHQGSPGEYHIYKTDRNPDIDISDAMHDFNIIEEVRYRDITTNPVTMERHQTVTVRQRAIDDIDISYCPDGPYIIRDWAKQVKRTLEDTILSGDPYPEDISTECDIERPNADAYSNPLPAPT